jgi:hypothetical protein
VDISSDIISAISDFEEKPEITEIEIEKEKPDITEIDVETVIKFEEEIKDSVEAEKIVIPEVIPEQEKSEIAEIISEEISTNNF